jgi:hypothetical protein
MPDDIRLVMTQSIEQSEDIAGHRPFRVGPMVGGRGGTA